MACSRVNPSLTLELSKARLWVITALRYPPAQTHTHTLMHADITQVATDVAARGIDIPSVDMVVNFDVPQNSKVGQQGVNVHWKPPRCRP